jgi:Highly conserved protein containing a thioredoxin domain
VTRELKPFYGGTYFPPEPRQGLPAFNRVLLSALHFFRTQRHEVDEAGNRITVELNRLSSLSDYEGQMEETPLRRFYEQRLEVFDSEHGGFGVAPKFPNPTDLSLLLRLSGHPGTGHKPRKRETHETETQWMRRVRLRFIRLRVIVAHNSGIREADRVLSRPGAWSS